MILIIIVSAETQETEPNWTPELLRIFEIADQGGRKPRLLRELYISIAGVMSSQNCMCVLESLLFQTGIPICRTCHAHKFSSGVLHRRGN
jgi:hypothetical protein